MATRDRPEASGDVRSARQPLTYDITGEADPAFAGQPISWAMAVAGMRVLDHYGEAAGEQTLVEQIYIAMQSVRERESLSGKG